MMYPCYSYRGVGWFTNFEYNRRHEFLPLRTMADNLKENAKLADNKETYCEYKNYNTIAVPETLATPCDFNGVMGFR